MVEMRVQTRQISFSVLRKAASIRPILELLYLPRIYYGSLLLIAIVYCFFLLHVYKDCPYILIQLWPMQPGSFSDQQKPTMQFISSCQ